MSSSNRVNVAYIKELVFGVTPTVSPELQDIRYTGETLRKDPATVQSQEIRSDRQVPDVIRTGISMSGDLNFEWSYGTYDVLLSSVFQHGAAWTTGSTITASDISAASADQSFNSTAGAFDATHFAAGRIIKVSGFTGASTTANGIWRVKTRSSANKIIVQGIAALIVDAAGETVTVVSGAYIRNGITFESYSFEKAYLDVASTFELANGVGLNTWGITIAPDQIITGSFGMLGRDLVPTAATAGDGGNTAQSTTSVMNAVDHIMGFMLASPSDVAGGNSQNLVSLDINIGNNLGARLQPGKLGAVSMRSGTCDVTGTISLYNEGNVLPLVFSNHGQSGFMVPFRDENGNIIVIDVPRVRFKTGGRNAEGINQDVIVELGFTGIRDPGFGWTISMTRFPGP